MGAVRAATWSAAVNWLMCIRKMSTRSLASLSLGMYLCPWNVIFGKLCLDSGLTAASLGALGLYLWITSLLGVFGPCWPSLSLSYNLWTSYFVR